MTTCRSPRSVTFDGRLAGGLARAAPVAAWMSGALFAFCGLAVAMRELGHTANAFEANAIRTGGGLVAACLAMLSCRRRPVLHDARNLRDLAVRNGVHWGASLLWTVAVTLVPLSTVFAIEFTAPVWVALLSLIFLRTHVSRVTVGALVAGFAGVLAVVRPDASGLTTAVLLPVAAAAGLGVSAMLTKGLTRRNGTLDIVFWMMALQFAANACVVSATTGLPRLAGKLAAGGAFAGYSTLLIGCGLVSQVCLTQALRRGAPVLVTSIDFLRIPLVSVIAYALYGESVGVHTVVGSLAIVAAVLAIAWDGGGKLVPSASDVLPTMAAVDGEPAADVVAVVAEPAPTSEAAVLVAA